LVAFYSIIKKPEIAEVRVRRSLLGKAILQVKYSMDKVGFYDRVPWGVSAWEDFNLNDPNNLELVSNLNLALNEANKKGQV
jgi:hypothetical protein